MIRKLCEIDGIKYAYSAINKKAIKLVSCDVPKGTIKIKLPDYIDNLPVTVLSKRFLAETKESISEIILPSHLEVIEERAFKKNTSLKSIVIPDSVTTLGVGAFEYCQSLESVQINKDKSLLETIGERCFYHCFKLNEFICPNNLKQINSFAFDGCTNKKGALTLYLNNNLEVFESNYLVGSDYDDNGYNIIAIKTSLNLIKRGLVRLNYHLAKVSLFPLIGETIDNGYTYAISEEGAAVTRIDVLSDEMIFKDKIEYKNKTYDVLAIMPEGIINVNDYVIKKISLPNNLEVVGDYAFKDIKFICPIILPPSLRIYYASAFNKAYSYLYFDLGEEQFQYVGYSVPAVSEFFSRELEYKLRKQTNVYFGFSKEQMFLEDGIYYLRTDEGVKCLKCIKLDTTEFPDLSKPLSSGEVINAVLPYCFVYCKNIKTITISSNIESIGAFAFSLNVEKVVFEENSKLKYIGSASLYFKSYPDIHLPPSVIYIDDNAFSESWVSSFASNVYLAPNSKLEYVGKNVFRSRKDKEMVFPKTIKVIDDYNIPYTAERIIFEDGAKPIYIDCPCSSIRNYPNLQFNEIDKERYLGSKENPNLVFCWPKYIGDPCLTIKEGTTTLSRYSLSRSGNLMYLDLPEGLLSFFGAPAHRTKIIVKKWPKSLMYIDEESLKCIDIENSDKLPDSVQVVKRDYIESQIYQKPRWI